MTRRGKPRVRCTLVRDGVETDDTWVLPVNPLNHAATDALLRHHLEGAIRGDGANPHTHRARQAYTLNVRRLDLPNDPTTVVRLP